MDFGLYGQEWDLDMHFIDYLIKEKYMRNTLLILLITVLPLIVNAQEKPVTQSIYLELGGAGLPYSLNYDFRFDKDRIDSWGMRVGAGGYAISGGDSFFSAPIQVNKLFGKNGHYFEFGAGATFLAFSSETYSYCQSGYNDPDTGEFICTDLFTSRSDFTEFILEIDGSPNVMGTLNFGYRKIPVDGGFMWKVNLNPIFNNSGFWPLWVGVGFGYAF